MLNTSFEYALAILAVNALALLLFWLDKRRATHNDRRIPEHVLLTVALLGGSPAAYYAMKRFRHKTRKTSFRLRFWCVVAIQLATVGYFMLLPK